MKHFQPDVVLVQLFANDVFEDNTARAKSLLDEKGLPLKTHRFFTKKYYNHPAVKREKFNENPIGYKIKRFLIGHSRMFEYFYVKFYNMQKASEFHQKMIRVDECGTGYQFFILDPDHVLSKKQGFRDKTWGYTKKYLLALRDEVKNQGVQFMLFYVPMEVQLELPEYGEHVSLYAQKHLGTYFYDLLSNFSSKNNILFLDFLNDFEANKGRGIIFQPRWTPDGSRA